MSENNNFDLSEHVRLLAGVLEPAVMPAQPFEESRMDFLAELGKELRKDRRTPAFTDVAAFGFWCRKGNLKRLSETLAHPGDWIGRGLAFHIAPSNVPVNFAYSYALGVLAGNGNIVRVSSKEFEQVSIICDAMERVFLQEQYAEMKNQTSIVSYGHDKEVTDYYSAICDTRIIWGGDETIGTIRESKVGSRCTEIAFADRYSFGIIRPTAILAMNEEEIRQLAVNFYNDTYLMDQNACTAPHMIVWYTDTDEEQEAAARAQQLFWAAAADAAGKYDLADIKVSDKFDRLCNVLADSRGAIPGVRRYDNLLYVVSLHELEDQMDIFRGSFGMFFEYEAKDLDVLAPFISKKVQTVAVCGVERREVVDFVMRNHLKGIDRITAFGQTLDMGMAWDGYDIIGTMARIIG